MLKRIFAPGSDSACTSLGLLVIRIWLGMTMLINHGYGKLSTFSDKAGSFPDPLGVGHSTSLTLAVFAEFFCSILVIVGFATRFAAFVLGITMAVAFFLVHKAALTGSHSGELAFIYLAGYLMLLIAGPGKLSADGLVFGKAASPK